MNRRRFCLKKGGSQEHISLITIMFCFNEFAFKLVEKNISTLRQALGTNMLNLIKIGQKVAEIHVWRFDGFQNGGRPPSSICEIQIL